MSTVHHGIRPAARVRRAVLAVVVFVGLAEAAHVVSVLAGPRGVAAGVAVIGAVFAACWVVFRVRPALHPARPACDCAPVTSAEIIPEPTRIAA